MKGFFKFIYILLLILLVPITGIGQNKTDDLEKVIAKYSGTKPVSFDLHYSKYYDKVEGDPVEVMQGKVIQVEGKRYHKLGNMEVIDVPEFTLMADHDNDKIMFTPVIKVPGPNGENIRHNKQAGMEDVLKFCSIDTVVKINNTTVLYKLRAKVAGGGKLNLYFNPSTYYIKELQIFYEQEEKRMVEGKEVAAHPVLVVKYSNHSNKELPADTFSYTRFLDKKGEKLTLKSAYGQYNYFGPETY